MLHRSYSRAGSGPQRERVSLKKIREDGLEKARMGITSLDEVARVVK